MKVGIIGAGIAGLACASHLARQGVESILFDKGKRPGGRLSTLVLDGRAWDFGAQYFRAKDPAFIAQCDAWQGAGILAPWVNGPQGALVGVPTMANLVAAQCAGLDVRFGALIQRIDAEAGGWFVNGPGLHEGPFDAIVVAIPAEQAVPLISLHDMMLARDAVGVRSKPCWTLMTAFDEPVAGLPDYLRGTGGIAWAARDNSKPGRSSAECWVVQAGSDWSQANLERDAADVATDMLALLAAEGGVELPEPVFLKAHRWRFALPFGQKSGHLWNGDLRLGACGDWNTGACIEDAWLAGAGLAADVADALQPRPKARARA